MIAAVLERFNSELVIKEVEFPIKTSFKETVIKVEASGLCRGDLHIIKGDWNEFIQISLPRILGHEVVGRVVDSEVYNKGDLVAVYNILGCGTCKYCKLGKPQYCNSPRFLGIDFDGGFAEYMKVPDNSMILKVDGDPISLAPLIDAGITAYNATKDIESGSRVLIIGTTSVAQIAVQILAYNNNEIVVVGRNSRKLGLFKDLGADQLIHITDYNSLSESLISELGNKKFDYILDFIGSESTLKEILWLLSKNGELRIIGEFGGNFEVNEQLLVLRGLRIRGVIYGDKEDLAKVYELYKQGIIRTITVKYPLSKINKAIHDLYMGYNLGRIVITPQ